MELRIDLSVALVAVQRFAGDLTAPVHETKIPMRNRTDIYCVIRENVPGDFPCGVPDK